jgi:phenylalanyl-tRNA synthetase alpha chain
LWGGAFFVAIPTKTVIILKGRYSNMKEKLSKIQAEALEQINAPDANLEEIKIKYLGKKGELTAVLRGMGALSPEERPIVGQLANEVREAIEAALNAKKA